MKSREKILATAGELIHTKGLNHTSIKDIVTAAKVTKSNFYYHFESKEQLAFEVLAERMRQFYALAIGPSLEDTGLDPLTRIDLFFKSMKSIGQSPIGELGCPFGNLAQEVSPTHEPLRRALSGFFHACSETMATCFEQGKETGVFKPSMPSKELADFVLAQLQGSLLLRKTHKEPKIIENNFELLRNLIGQWIQ